MKTYALIPTRLESSRLPRKAVLDICGLPMILHVAHRARLCKDIDEVFVCTDSDLLANIVLEAGFQVCITGCYHKNGTERIAEAAETLQIEEDALIVDLQGDEPLVSPDVISAVIKKAKRALAAPTEIFLPNSPLYEMGNLNIVKVVCSSDKVLYLTRADAPVSFASPCQLKKHLSIIVFTRVSLRAFSLLEAGDLELSEGVELLRAIEGGMVIRTDSIETDSFSVDTNFDLERARRVMGNCKIYDIYRQATL